MTSNENESEFGMGLAYCLGLFLAHAPKLDDWIQSHKEMRKTGPYLFTEAVAVEMFFNGASDHFYEFQPDAAPTEEIKKRAHILKDRCLDWGHGFKRKSTKKDGYWAIQEAKDLLRLIDEAHGVPTKKGQYE